MAEYAGLEIRIGGNTTSLNKALTASTKSAAELQSRIRQITRAMQFDPTDLKNVETRVRITGDRMQSLQAKVQLLRTAMKQLGDTMTEVLDPDGKAMSVRRIASETKDLSLAAKQADERFNGLTGSLSEVYEAWNRLSRKKGAEFLSDGLGLTQADAERLMRETTSMRAFMSELDDIRMRARDVTYTGPIISEADIARAKEFKELNFHDMFKRGLELDDVIEEAKQLGITLEDSAISNVRELQEAFKGAQAEKKALDSALQYDQLGVDLQRIESEAEGLSQTMRSLDDGLTLTARTPWFRSLEDDVRRLDAAIGTVDEDLRRTGEAMKADPSDIQLAVRYMDDLRQKAELSEEKVRVLRAEMDQLDANGASKAAEGHRDLAKWIEESAEAARVAQKELSAHRAEVSNLEDQVRSAEQRLVTIKKDATVATYSDNVLEWQHQTKLLSDALEELGKRQTNVANEQEKLGNISAGHERAAAEAEEYGERLASLREEYARLEAAAAQAFDSDMPIDDLVAELGRLDNEIREVSDSYGSAKLDVEQATAAMEDQQGRVKMAQSTLKDQEAAVESYRKKVEALAQTSEVKLLQNPTGEIERTEAELDGLRKKLTDATAKTDGLEKAYDSAKSENELAKTAKKLQDVGQEANEATADVRRMNEELSSKGSGILNASTVKSIGMTLSATITPLITGIGYSMLDASSTVDAAYRDMRKTVDGTEEQFESLRKSAIEFSRTHVTSADQILQIEAIGGELGIATENLETFAEVISNIDVATNLDVEGAADALGHLANIMNLTESDYVGFSDALVRLGNNGASTETEIANIAERIGSMASIVGMSAPDVLAWSSSIASTGQNAEAAGTAISKTMSFFETAVAAAGGTIDTSFGAIDRAVQEGGASLVVFSNLMGQTADDFTEAWASDPDAVFGELTESVEGAKKSLQGIADVTHMSADEFAKAWESDPTKVLQAFIKGLNEVEDSGGSADAVLQGFGITSVRQKQAIEGLMQTIGGLDDNLRMSDDAWNGISDQWGQAGDAANEAAKKAEGFSGQMQILKNMWQIFLSELGEGAVPWIKTFSGVVTDLSTWFSSLTAETKKWVVAAGGISALTGPILSMGASFATAWGEVHNWWTESLSGMNLVKMAFRVGGQEMVDSLTDTMGGMDKLKIVAKSLGLSLLNGLAVGAVVAGIVAIGSELKRLYDDYKAHVAATDGLSKAISGIGKSAGDATAGLDANSESIRQLIRDSRDYERRLADLAGTISESNAQYGAYAGQMDYYSTTIRELGGRSDLSRAEVAKLSSALEAVNEQCGTTYAVDEYGRIIETSTGKVMANTDAILANIDARRNQALMEYYADDYAQAVEQWAKAQDGLSAATERYNELASPEGKQAYLDSVRDMKGALYDEGQALAAYDYELGVAKKDMENYATEVSETEKVMGNIEGQMDVARVKMESANRAVEESAKVQQEFDARVSKVTGDVTGNMSRLSAAVTDAGKGDAAFNSIASGLNAIHVYANELDDVDMASLVAAFDGVDGSMADVISTLEQAGVSTKTWHAAIDGVPGAAERMGSITAAAFDSMYEVAGQDLGATMELVAGLDEMEVGGKTFFIGDGGTIVDEQGRVYDLTEDLAEIPDEVITKLAGDDADLREKLLENKRQLSDLDQTTASPTVTLTDYATAKIDWLNQRLNELGNKRTNTVITVSEQATGGMNSRAVVPLHATGYIATGPTLTNQGWIGEDGIEAVANWATGGAVVPLTNKRYMLPIADAIASGIAARGYGMGSTSVTVQLNYEAGTDANQMAQGVARAVARVMDARR